jgi:ribbon-helix-helix CopG family protein
MSSRTTIRLDPVLDDQLKALARSEGRTFTALIEEAVARLLAERRKPAKRKRIVLPTSDGGGFHSGVRLNDNAAMLDLMEEDLPWEKRR